MDRRRILSGRGRARRGRSAQHSSSSTPRVPTPAPRSSSTPSRCSRPPRSSTRARRSRTRRPPASSRSQAVAQDAAARRLPDRRPTPLDRHRVAAAPSTRVSRSSRRSAASRRPCSPRCRSRTSNMAISVNLTDPARVAGFVNPGSEVAIFLTGTDPSHGPAGSRGSCSTRVTVLGVGSTTPVSTTTTDESGASTTEQLPSDPAHPLGRPDAGREGPVRPGQRRARLRSPDRRRARSLPTPEP